MSEGVPVEERVQVAGRSVRLLRGGTGDPALVLHHSTGSRGWEPLAEALAGSFSVVVPDLPGYGQSERPEWARSPRDIAILVGRLIDRLELPAAHIVGLGFGGWVAAELATLTPRRLATLTLVGAAGLKPRQGEIADQVQISYEQYVRLGFSSDASFEEVFGAEPDKPVVELLGLQQRDDVPPGVEAVDVQPSAAPPPRRGAHARARSVGKRGPRRFLSTAASNTPSCCPTPGWRWSTPATSSTSRIRHDWPSSSPTTPGEPKLEPA